MGLSLVSVSLGRREEEPAAEAKETLILGIEVESETDTVCPPLCEDFWFEAKKKKKKVSLNRVILNLPEERSVTHALF